MPYVWFLGRGVGIVGDALVTGFVVGTLLAVFLASLGVLISLFAASNRVSLSLSLFVLLALFAPTQLPSSAQQGWAGELLLRINPLTAGEHYVGKIVTNGHGWSEDVSWLISPLVAAAVFAAAGLVVGARFTGWRRWRRMRGDGSCCCSRLSLGAVPAAGPASRSSRPDRRSRRSSATSSSSARRSRTPARRRRRPDRPPERPQPGGDVYVDPEDWSSHRTRYLAPFPPAARPPSPGGWKRSTRERRRLRGRLPRSGPRPPTTGPTVHVPSPSERR